MEAAQQTVEATDTYPDLLWTTRYTWLRSWLSRVLADKERFRLQELEAGSAAGSRSIPVIQRTVGLVDDLVSSYVSRREPNFGFVTLAVGLARVEEVALEHDGVRIMRERIELLLEDGSGRWLEAHVDTRQSDLYLDGARQPHVRPGDIIQVRAWIVFFAHVTTTGTQVFKMLFEFNNLHGTQPPACLRSSGATTPRRPAACATCTRPLYAPGLCSACTCGGGSASS